MKIRQALLAQSPSLALQRAASDLVALLDSEVFCLGAANAELASENKNLANMLECALYLLSSMCDQLNISADKVELELMPEDSPQDDVLKLTEFVDLGVALINSREARIAG